MDFPLFSVPLRRGGASQTRLPSLTFLSSPPPDVSGAVSCLLASHATSLRPRSFQQLMDECCPHVGETAQFCFPEHSEMVPTTIAPKHILAEHTGLMFVSKNLSEEVGVSPALPTPHPVEATLPPAWASREAVPACLRPRVAESPSPLKGSSSA